MFGPKKSSVRALYQGDAVFAVSSIFKLMGHATDHGVAPTLPLLSYDVKNIDSAHCKN
jgi:hypothetical protein